MANAAINTVFKQMDQLLRRGSVGGLTDAELLGRFRAERDQDAFAALVARHGRMVLSVCRGVLRDPSDAEDAFQATFLILIRKADAIWVGESLGGWLHRVAYRVALQVNRDADRRRVAECGAALTAVHCVTPSMDEIGQFLHAEIDRLPDRLRLPLVLCDLEGLTREQAAEQLGIREGAFRGRLAKARALLRTRLIRRGVPVASGGALSILAADSTFAAVPEAWFAAARQALNGPAAVSAAAVIAGRVGRSLVIARAKVMVGALLGVLLTACAGVAYMAPPAPNGGEAITEPPPAKSSQVAKNDDKRALKYFGRVLDPSGRPVSHARMYLFSDEEWGQPSPVRATTGPDGRFAFEASDKRFDTIEERYRKRLPVIAFADGLGFATTDYSQPSSGRELTISLSDDFPLEAQVVDLEGRAVVGARVTAQLVWIPAPGKLDLWLTAVRAGENHPLNLMQKYLTTGYLVPEANGGPIPASTTDAQGRFRMSGLGRDRLVNLLLEGPTIRRSDLHVLTRDTPVTSISEVDSITVYGARSRIVVPPGRVVRGVIRDQKSGQPLAGVKVRSKRFSDGKTSMTDLLHHGTSDASGIYQLSGFPQGAGNEILAVAPGGSPYLPAGIKLEAPPGLGGIERDIAMTRGILVEGRVIDAVTKRPVRASISYHADVKNPHLSEAPGFREIPPPFYDLQTETDAEGRFKCAALPGPGVLVVQAVGDFSEVAERSMPERQAYVPELEHTVQAVRKLDLTEGQNPAVQEFSLVPKLTISGTVLDPEGQPLAGSFVFGLKTFGSWAEERLDAASFKVVGSNSAPNDSKRSSMSSDAGRTIIFQHEGRKLAGWLDVVGNEQGPFSVKLAPWASAGGRIVDEQAKPRSGVIVSIYVTKKDQRGGGQIEHRPSAVFTDTEGRFRVEGLAPGLSYQLVIGGGELREPDRTLDVGPFKPGEVRDLGDLTAIAKPKMRIPLPRTAECKARSTDRSTGQSTAAFQDTHRESSSPVGRNESGRVARRIM
jgi:RNA polymerase sigma factor (sigma-70 family)